MNIFVKRKNFVSSTVNQELTVDDSLAQLCSLLQISSPSRTYSLSCLSAFSTSSTFSWSCASSITVNLSWTSPSMIWGTTFILGISPDPLSIVIRSCWMSELNSPNWASIPFKASAMPCFLVGSTVFVGSTFIVGSAFFVFDTRDFWGGGTWFDRKSIL